MTKDSLTLILRSALRPLFKTEPSETEISDLVTFFSTRMHPELLAPSHVVPDPNQNAQIRTHWDNGHYYSPVVNPDADVLAYWNKEQRLLPSHIHGIQFNMDSMMSFWQANAEYLLQNPFPDKPNGTTRYHSENGSFPGGDAVFLGGILHNFRPRRIIEIGSGNSTAAMLDWKERLALKELDITCVEPDPVRVKSILRADDKITIIPKMVQAVELSLFAQLQPNDILFIDSTHVLKTGSDVHHELFYILPTLARGVIIHFHDCAYPFEYPKEAVFDMNFSWNEAYAIRSFLMYNSCFRVFFWNSMFYRLCPPHVREQIAGLSGNPGGGIWIVKNE